MTPTKWTPLKSRLLLLRATGHDIHFVVHTGTSVSVLHPHPHLRVNPQDILLLSAAGTPIKSYGTATIMLRFHLACTFKWTFVVAKVQSCYLGAYFLYTYGLTVDLRNKCLHYCDEPSQPSIRGFLSAITANIAPLPCLGHIESAPMPMQLQDNPLGQPTHAVEHHIITQGPPVYATARRLNPEKYRAAKEEFNQLLRLNVI